MADGSTIPAQVREAVRLAAEHVPVATCFGAARSEIEATLAAADIRGSRDVLVFEDAEPVLDRGLSAGEYEGHA